MGKKLLAGISCIFILLLFPIESFCGKNPNWFDVRDFGACGTKENSSENAIKFALISCAEKGGGIVYFPPGEYNTGEICLGNKVGIYLEKGAVIYPSKKEGSFPRGALIYAKNADFISIEGEGKIDGQSEHILKEYGFTDPNVNPNAEAMKNSGGEVKVPYPVSPSPRMVFFQNCRNVSIKDVSFINSGSWTVHLRLCNDVKISGVSIFTSLSEGVWADGIDVDSCKDVRISDCVIETGDDAICLKTMKESGENRTCENISVTNCRLTSSSCAFKFGDEIYSDIRKVIVDNCIIAGANRGIGICLREKGNVSDVIFSDLIIDCSRHEWFWWGDGDPIYFMMEQSIYAKEKTVPGKIMNVEVNNVIAHAKGTSKIYGFPGKCMENISFRNVKIYLSEDRNVLPRTDYGFFCNDVNNLTMKDFEIHWDNPASEKWSNALYIENAKNLTIDSFRGTNSPLNSNNSVIYLKNVSDCIIKDSLAFTGTNTFISVYGEKTENILFDSNNFSNSRQPLVFGKEVKKNRIKQNGNIK